MLTRNVDLSGSGTGGCGIGSGAVGGDVGWGVAGTVGAEVQAATSSTGKTSTSRMVLVTETNAHYVDPRGSQPAARHIQLVQIFDGSDVNAIVVPVVDSCALHP